jgi:DNA-binding transcriptional regulator YiaG
MLTPHQIHSLRTRLKLTADLFAESLGLIGKYRALTVYKWESGSKKPGPQTVLLMKSLARNPHK